MCIRLRHAVSKHNPDELILWIQEKLFFLNIISKTESDFSGMEVSGKKYEIFHICICRWRGGEKEIQ